MLGFDTETTGVSPHHSRIVTASIVVTGEEPHTYSWLINPHVEIPSAAQQVHGISTARARRDGTEPLFALAQIRDLLVDGMTAGHPLVVFNAPFDLTLVESELARHGLDTMSELLGRDPFPVLDPLVLDRILDPYRKGPRRLETLIGLYRIDAGGFHDAENDVVATLKLLKAMVDSHALLRASSLRKLHELQRSTHETWAESFNRYLVSRGRVGDVEGYWPIAPAAVTDGTVTEHDGAPSVPEATAPVDDPDRPAPEDSGAHQP